jgi:hypothetical protein
MVFGISMSRVLEGRERHEHRGRFLIRGAFPHPANIVAFVYPDVRWRSPMLANITAETQI